MSLNCKQRFASRTSHVFFLMEKKKREEQQVYIMKVNQNKKDTESFLEIILSVTYKKKSSEVRPRTSDKILVETLK